MSIRARSSQFGIAVGITGASKHFKNTLLRLLYRRPQPPFRAIGTLATVEKPPRLHIGPIAFTVDISTAVITVIEFPLDMERTPGGHGLQRHHHLLIRIETCQRNAINILHPRPRRYARVITLAQAQRATYMYPQAVFLRTTRRYTAGQGNICVAFFNVLAE